MVVCCEQPRPEHRLVAMLYVYDHPLLSYVVPCVAARRVLCSRLGDGSVKETVSRFTSEAHNRCCLSQAAHVVPRLYVSRGPCSLQLSDSLHPYLFCGL